MFPLKQAFCFDATVSFLHPDRSNKHDIPLRVNFLMENYWVKRQISQEYSSSHHTCYFYKQGFVTENVEGLAQPVERLTAERKIAEPGS